MNIYRSGDADQRKPALRPLTPKRDEQVNRQPPGQKRRGEAEPQSAARRLRRVEAGASTARAETDVSVGRPGRIQRERHHGASGPGLTSVINRSVRVPLWAIIAAVILLSILPAVVIVTQVDPFGAASPPVSEPDDQLADESASEEVSRDVEPIIDGDQFEEPGTRSVEQVPRSSRQEFLAEQGVNPEDHDIRYGADEVERLQRELEAIQRNSAMLRSLARQQSGDLSLAYSSLEATEEEKDGALEDLQERIDELESRVQTVDELARDLRSLLGLPQSESGVGGPVDVPPEESDPWLALRAEIVAVEQHAGALVYDLDEVNTEIQLRLAQVEQTGLPRGSSLQSDLQFYDAMPVGWPINGPVTSRFGLRANPFGTGTDSHTGIDISAPLGAGVRATGEGTVRHAGEYGGYGLLVIVDHGRGVSTWYGHNSNIRVSPGQWVDEGDILADVGSTGMSTGPHVHYEIRINNQPQDPLSLMQMER